jgi:preprotein translocase subunit SecD
MGVESDEEFQGFMRGRWSAMVRLAYTLTGDQGHAEDIAQAAFASAYASWGRVSRAGDPEAYVRAIVIHENNSQVTSATADQLPSSGQWVVDVTLNGAATAAFAQLTASQATLYYPASQRNWNDAVLASTAIVIDGDVQFTPVTQAPITIGKLMIAGSASGLTEAEAKTLAAHLSTTSES